VIVTPAVGTGFENERNNRARDAMWSAVGKRRDAKAIGYSPVGVHRPVSAE
jgi:hypothetical protein